MFPSNTTNMNIEEFRELCLSFPHTTEEFPFDETTLVFKVFNKMFTYADIMPFETIALKCDPDRAIELREKYPEITPAYHSNKKHWNGVYMHGSLSDKFIEELVEHSYREVIKKLPKNFVQKNFPEFSLTESNRKS